MRLRLPGTSVGCRIAIEQRAKGQKHLATRDRISAVVKKGLGFLAGAALAVPLAYGADAGPCPAHLFVIERNKNANIVVYDANLGPAGDFAASEPVKVYWLMNANKGEREELNVVESRRAYGFNVVPGDAPATYTMTFKAGKGKRHLTIRMLNGCPVAIASINGRSGILRKLFVQSTEGLTGPTVQYVELFGDDAENGEPLHEKFTPGK